MVSIDHEVLVKLVREDPGILAELLRSLFGITVPNEKPTVLDSSLNQFAPTVHLADVVVAFGKDLAVIVEAQRQRADRKRYAWPAYVANLGVRQGGRVHLVVLTHSEKVAQWAKRAASFTHPAVDYRSFVLWPGVVPKITDPNVARAKPGLTLLSALLGATPFDLDSAPAGAIAAQTLDPDEAEVYIDYLFRAAGPAAPLLMEKIMSTTFAGYEFKSEFALKYLNRGRKEGLEQGQLDHAHRAVLTVLEERGISVSAAELEAILTVTDLSTLDHWHRLAIRIPSTEALLANAPAGTTPQDR